MEISNNRGITCQANGWAHHGPELAPRDDEYATGFRVLQYGTEIGYITTDRARFHPDVQWKRYRTQSGRRVELPGECETAQQAFMAFVEEPDLAVDIDRVETALWELRQLSYRDPAYQNPLTAREIERMENVLETLRSWI